MIRVEIQAKLPSCNNYINANRNNRYLGASMKRKTEELIYYYIKDIPVFEKPIKINFIWVEENKKKRFRQYMFRKEIYT